MRIAYIDCEDIFVYEKGNTKKLTRSVIDKYEEDMEENEWEYKRRFVGSTFFFGDLCFKPDGKTLVYSVMMNEHALLATNDVVSNEETLILTQDNAEIGTVTVRADGVVFVSLHTIDEKESYLKMVAGNALKKVDIAEKVANPVKNFYAENPFWDEEKRLYFNRYKIKDGKVCNSEIVRRKYWVAENMQSTRNLIKEEKENVNVDRIAPQRTSNGALYYITRKNINAGFFKKLSPLFEGMRNDVTKEFIKLIHAEEEVETISNYKKTHRHRNTALYSNGGLTPKGQAWVHNQLLRLDKINKKNRKKPELGYIPASWKLVRYQDEKETVLAEGVADYDIVEENGKTVIVYTIGSAVYKLYEDETGIHKERLFTTDRCLKLCAHK